MKTTINADGSGDVAIRLSMTKSNYDQAKSLGGDPFAKAKDDFKKAGYQTVDSSDGTDAVGFSASRHYGDVTGDVIPRAIGEAMKIAESTTAPTAKVPSGTLKHEKTLTSDTFVADFTIPTSSNQGSTYKVQVVMPGAVGTTNADEKVDGGKTLQWTLKAGEDNSLKAMSTVDQNGRLIGIGIAAAVGLVVLILIVVLLMRRKGSSAAPASMPTPPAPIPPLVTSAAVPAGSDPAREPPASSPDGSGLGE